MARSGLEELSMTTSYELKKKERWFKPGFTLIEIMIALAIIGLVLGVVIPWANNQFQQAKVRTTRMGMKNVQFAIQQYHMDTGVYPSRLRDLVKRPADEQIASKWTSPYLPDKQEPKDSWSNKYQYKVTEGGKHPYELKSYGPGGKGSPKEEQIDVWNLD